MTLGDKIKTSDWKTEKHVPVIECGSEVKAGEIFDIKVSIGKEIAHPNTTAHHIRWINVFFHPKGGSSSYQIGNFEFTAHGESTDGADKSGIYTNHSIVLSMKTDKPGTIYALALCNIHGLWENSKEIKVI